jgi:DNA repair protein RecO (recombination protein O)
MPALTCDAYVLVRHPLTESSWIVSFFTRDSGVVRAVAKGAKRVKSPFRGALETMNRVRAELVVKEGRGLGTVRSVDVLESALDLFGNWPKASVLMAMAEVLERGLPEHGEEEETYRLTGAALEGLRAGAPPPLAWVYFQTWFLRLHGVFPRTEHCAGCDRDPHPLHFDWAAGDWLCPACRERQGTGGVSLGRGGETLLAAMMARSLKDLAGESFPPGDVKALAALVSRALAEYLGGPLASAPSDLV